MGRMNECMAELRAWMDAEMNRSVQWMDVTDSSNGCLRLSGFTGCTYKIYTVFQKQF
jgi:hypothetical protein